MILYRGHHKLKKSQFFMNYGFLFCLLLYECGQSPESDKTTELYYSLISPAHLKAHFATITAIISFMIAAATIVPDTTDAREGSIEDNVVTDMPVNTHETPE